MTTVETNLTREEYRQLLAKAKEEGISVRELVQRAILRMLREDSVDPSDPVFKVVVDGPPDSDTVGHDRHLYA